MDDAQEIRRRLRAARAYADLSLDGLAAAVEIGRNTLVRIENGSRNPKAMELRAVADACGLPYEFFTVDFADLAALAHIGAGEVLGHDALRETVIAAVDEAFDRKLAESTPEEVEQVIRSAEADRVVDRHAEEVSEILDGDEAESTKPARSSRTSAAPAPRRGRPQRGA
jgi:transcriptional regulator with XRE-family HTH domain